MLVRTSHEVEVHGYNAAQWPGEFLKLLYK